MTLTKTFVAAFTTYLAIVSPAMALAPNALVETRICGTPARAKDGSIVRSRAVLRAFQRQHPCPSTGKTSGACPGWAMDHVIPLASCGCDAVSNLQWLKDETKSCSGPQCKDRYERQINTCPTTGDLQR